MSPCGNAAATIRQPLPIGCTFAPSQLGTEFHILGPLEVRAGGRPLRLTGRKQRALLALLLLARGEAVSADRLIDELWPDADPAAGRKALQVRISQLRKALGPDVLLTRDPGYVIEPGGLDLDRFEALCAEARGASDPATTSRKLADALALWRGEPLADLGFEPFAQVDAARLEEARLAALEDRIDADLALGCHAELIAELDALIGRHPLRERLRAQRMLALYRAGRQADALAEYRDARETLVGELGIEPGRDLRELERSILDQDPTLDTPAPPEPTGPLFVGRERELAVIRDAIAAAEGGDGRLVLIGGEPGAGKTRLADEAARRAAGCRVLLGRCWEAGGAPAFWPWVQPLRAWLENADDVAAVVGRDAPDLAQVLPELLDLLGELPPPVAAGPEGARFRLFDAIASLIRRIADEQPLVLVLDDLHAADDSSLLLLELLAARLPGSRVVVLGAFRTTDVEAGSAMARALAELARQPGVTRLHLTGLSETEVHTYVRAQDAGSAPPASLTAAIHHATDGNPLFVTELSRLLAEEGALGREVERLPIPAGVRDVIERRLERLPARCRDLLELGSVLGRDVDARTLAEMAELKLADLHDALEPARRAAVIASGARLRFSHALVRDALYERIPAARRPALHEAAAGALERLHAADPEPHLAEIAHHLLAAGAGARAVEFARRAGRRAVAVHAYEEAERLFALALEEHRRSDATRCDILLELGDAQSRAGRGDAARATFVEAAVYAREHGDVGRLATAAVGYGGLLVWIRAFGDTMLIDLLEEALAALPPDHPGRVGLGARLGGALRDWPERAADRDRLSAEAVDLARRLGDPELLAHALDGRYPAIWTAANTEERLRLGQELIEAARRAGSPQRLHHGWIGVAIAHLDVGDMPRARHAVGEMRRLADLLRQPSQEWITCGGEALLELAVGQLDESERLLERGYAAGLPVLGEEARFARVLQLAQIRRLQGRAGEVADELEDIAYRAPARAKMSAALATVLVESGREDDAARILARIAADGFACVAFDNEWLSSVCFLAEVAVALAEREHAATLYELLLPYAGLNALDFHEIWLGSVSRLLGLLAETLARTDAAVRHFTDAVAMDRRTGSVLTLAASEAALARVAAEPASQDRQG